jgi:hypothetical protein
VSRSPLAYPLTRNAEGDAGGVADLQTDVMRFMAILAICLVAIFALVQSIPPDPVTEPVPTSQPEPAPKTEPITAAKTEPQTEPPTPQAPDVRQGFTLQFENDLALTRLVARNEIGLYAIGGDKSLRMNVNRGRFSFWPASTPNQFHEMNSATVPHDVATALFRTRDDPAITIKWGVTLPADMQQRLDELLQTGDSGAIYIAANGQLRLEN